MSSPHSERSASEPSDRLVAKGKHAWPALPLPTEVFARYVAERIPDATSDLVDAAIHIEDLYLVCACLHGVRGAISAFESRHASDLDLALSRSGLDAQSKRDVRAELFSTLFTAVRGRRPLLLGYRGTGPLSAWLRVCAGRFARATARRDRARPIEERVEDLSYILPSQPEEDAFRSRLSAAIHSATERAFAALSPEERDLLARRYLDEQTVDELARERGVHRVTMARRLSRLQSGIRLRVKSILASRAGSSRADIDNLWREIEPELEISVGRLLAAPTRGPVP